MSALEVRNKQDSYKRYVCNPTLVQQIEKVIFYIRGDEALRSYTDVYATGYEWQLVDSWDNRHSKTSGSKTLTMEVGRNTSSGSEWEAHFEISAAYGGFGASVGGSYKSFSSEELSTKHTRQTTINVGAGESFYYYQKVYKFTTSTWFRNDAWKMNRVVYRDPGNTVLEVPGSFESRSNETKTTAEPLQEGTGDLTIQSQAENVRDKYDGTRVAYKWTGTKAKNKLAPLGSLLYDE